MSSYNQYAQCLKYLVHKLLYATSKHPYKFNSNSIYTQHQINTVSKIIEQLMDMAKK